MALLYIFIVLFTYIFLIHLAVKKACVNGVILLPWQLALLWQVAMVIWWSFGAQNNMYKHQSVITNTDTDLYTVHDNFDNEILNLQNSIIILVMELNY